MLHEVFNRLKQNQDDLISFNNFLSTSTSKEVALNFVKNAQMNSEKVAILFEMNVDPSISSIPFASLDKLSYFSSSEHEVLFSMYIVFRIGEIKSVIDNDKSQFWHVYLTLTHADNDEQLSHLTEHMRRDLSSYIISTFQINTDPTRRLCKLLATSENNLKLAQAAHYQLVEIFVLYKDDWERARIHGKKIFCVELLDGSDVTEEVRTDLIKVYSRLRKLFYTEQIDDNQFHSIMADIMNTVITLYLDYSSKTLGSREYQVIVDRYNYIGWVRKEQGKLSEAWTYHEQALELLHKYLPPTHPRLAITYNYISSLHLMMKNYSNALDYLKKALEIQEKALQPNHPHLAKTHFHMSITYEWLNKIDDAFQHAKKAINISRHALTSDDLNMIKYQEQFDKIFLLIQSCNELVL